MAKDVALTYREFATRLGIKVESARKTARRKDWKRLEGSDGTVRILVPESYLAEMRAMHAPLGQHLAAPVSQSRNEVAIEFLEDILREHGEELGPALRYAIGRLQRDAIKRLVMDVASRAVA